MSTHPISPKIESISWGTLTTNDGKEFKDAKLFPRGSRKWDWNETGTHHIPGIQPSDVEELIANGAKVIVLAQGFNERLQVCDETKQMLSSKGIDYYILQTEEAVKKYNELRTNQAVGALIHPTC